jgi:hypothetical protein
MKSKKQSVGTTAPAMGVKGKAKLTKSTPMKYKKGGMVKKGGKKC